MVDEWAYHSYTGGPGPGPAVLVRAISDQLLYRPLNVAWRLWGLVLRIRGRTEWGEEMQRSGYKVVQS
jgi:hypothetical protein